MPSLGLSLFQFFNLYWVNCILKFRDTNRDQNCNLRCFSAFIKQYLGQKDSYVNYHKEFIYSFPESKFEERIEKSEIGKINKKSTVEERNEERIKIMLDFCESSKLKKKRITQLTLNHIHIDHKSKTLYCFVPKVNVLFIMTIILNMNYKP